MIVRRTPSRDVTVLIRSLGEEGAALRRALESLKANPMPEWARPLPDVAGGYEWLVAGYCILYEVDRSDPSETVIRVSVIEAN